MRSFNARRLSWLRWAFRLAGATALAGVLLVVFTSVAFIFGQDLKVVRGQQGTYIDVTWLSEYQSNVRKIRITEAASGRVVWDIEAEEGESFPFWTMPIKPGSNAALPDGVTGVEVVAPTTATFMLNPDVHYRIDLWTYKDWHVPRHVSTTFVLREGQGA